MLGMMKATRMAYFAWDQRSQKINSAISRGTVNALMSEVTMMSSMLPTPVQKNGSDPILTKFCRPMNLIGSARLKLVNE